MMTSSNGNISALLANCAGNSKVTSKFPTQRPVTRSLMFSLICAWINGWVNNSESGDLRHHLTHYDVTVMNWWWWSDNDYLCCSDFYLEMTPYTGGLPRITGRRMNHIVAFKENTAQKVGIHCAMPIIYVSPHIFSQYFDHFVGLMPIISLFLREFARDFDQYWSGDSLSDLHRHHGRSPQVGPVTNWDLGWGLLSQCPTFFTIVKTLLTYWISLSYLIGVAATHGDICQIWK